MVAQVDSTWVEKGGKSLLLCLPLTGPKERGGLSEWALMLRIETPGHKEGVFLLHVHIGVFVCNLPVFCGPMTMNLGNLSQVFSLDQMSLCRLSSHGFYGGTDKIRDLYACCIMHTKTYMLIHAVGFRMNE